MTDPDGAGRRRHRQHRPARRRRGDPPGLHARAPWCATRARARRLPRGRAAGRRRRHPARHACRPRSTASTPSCSPSAPTGRQGRRGDRRLRRRPQRPGRPGHPAGPHRADDRHRRHQPHRRLQPLHPGPRLEAPLRAAGARQRPARTRSCGPAGSTTTRPTSTGSSCSRATPARPATPATASSPAARSPQVLVAQPRLRRRALRKTFELVAEHGPAPDDLDALFAPSKPTRPARSTAFTTRPTCRWRTSRNAYATTWKQSSHAQPH